MNLYLPIEVKVRELESKSLLAFAAAERGHLVLLGSKTDTLVNANQGKLPPGIVHMKSITPSETTLKQMQLFQEHGHAVTCQDEEGGVVDESYGKFAKIRFSEESLKLTDRVFGWGDFDTAALKELFPAFSSYIVNTGTPRADFWREDFKSFHAELRSNKHEPDRPFILVASNFGGILNENRTWNVFARLREAGYFDRDTTREDHEYENLSYQVKLIGKFVKLIRNLAIKFPEIDILVRPHPVESVEGWHKLIGDYPNIIVKRKGSITAWIHSSMVVLHNGCTTAMEAAVCGVPRIAYRPDPSPIEREIPNMVSHQAFTEEEVMDMVDQLVKRGKLPDDDAYEQKVSELLTSRFRNIEGKLAADLIVDEWEKLAIESGLKTSNLEDLIATDPNRSNGSGNRFVQWFREYYITNIKKEKAPTDPDANKDQLLDTSFKFKDFSEAEMTSLLHNLQKSQGRFQNLKFRRYNEKSFLVYREDV
jgi:surface carbohydrate biosynthesis protein